LYLNFERLEVIKVSCLFILEIASLFVFFFWFLLVIVNTFPLIFLLIETLLVFRISRVSFYKNNNEFSFAQSITFHEAFASSANALPTNASPLQMLVM